MSEEINNAARHAAEAMRRLGIKGAKVTTEVGDIAKITTIFPTTKSYFQNSKQYHDKCVQLMDRFPGVNFDFDVEFATKVHDMGSSPVRMESRKHPHRMGRRTKHVSVGADRA